MCYTVIKVQGVSESYQLPSSLGFELKLICYLAAEIVSSTTL